MSSLPDNLIPAQENIPQGKPLATKYSEADILRGAYFLLLSEIEDGPAKDKILHKKDRPEVSRFAREVAYFADDRENRTRIEKFLTNHADKCKLKPSNERSTQTQ